jgi:hypothetical protein
LEPWINDTPLFSAFPMLFDISLSQGVTFELVIQCELNIHFRKRTTHDLLAQWNNIKACVVSLHRYQYLIGGVWSLNHNKMFSTKYVYHMLERDIFGSHNKWIWKAKIPMKIKKILWQFYQD